MICRFWFLAIFPPAILAKNMFGMIYTAVHCSDSLIYIRWMNDVHCSTLLWCSDIYQMNEWCTLQYIALMLWYTSDEWMMYTAVHCSDALMYIRWMNDVHCSTLLWCSDIHQMNDVHWSTLIWYSDIYQMNEWCTLQYIALML